MISKGKNPTATELKWRGIVSEFAAESTWLVDWFGEYVSDPYLFEIDHILGAQAKRKINFESVKVGEYAILPMPFMLHNVLSKHKLNRTTNPGKFRENIIHEKLLFGNMINAMKRDGYGIPFSDEIVNAIVKG